MLVVDLCESYVPTISPPRNGARGLGISLNHLFYQRDPNAKEDVINYDYLDDQKGHALRYRYIVGPRYHAFLQASMPRINQAGWHLTLENKRAKNRWQLVFEPTLTAGVSGRGMIFWHLSPADNADSILQNGLLPKPSRHDLRYPQDRIYLLRRGEDAAQMVEAFAQRDKGQINYVVFKIDLRRATGIKVHTDPELSQVAVYTTQAIPAQFISLG